MGSMAQKHKKKFTSWWFEKNEKIQDGGGGHLENGRLLDYADTFARDMEAKFFI